MKLGLIYLHTCIPTGLSYVGQTTNNINIRKYCGYGGKFLKDLTKYGWDSIETKILESDIPIDLLSERESFWIKKLKTAKDGYNVSLGGKSKGLFQEFTCIDKDGNFLKYFESLKEAKEHFKTKYVYTFDFGNARTIKDSILLKGRFTPEEAKEKIKGYKL